MAGLIEIKFDGAFNKDLVGVGVAVYFDREFIPEESKAVTVVPHHLDPTVNIAEWEGCIEAFKKAIELQSRFPGNNIQIYSDSQVITNQFNGDYSINKEEFKAYYDTAWSLCSMLEIEGFKINWISRDFNKEADKLSKEAKKGENENIRYEYHSSLNKSQIVQ